MNRGVSWANAPEWAAYHAFDEQIHDTQATGRWWEHRPLRFYKKYFWENPDAGTNSVPSGFVIPGGVDWKFSIEARPSVIDPVIVCLCGSTRFWREFQRASLEETLAGKIVLSIGAASGTDDEHFGNLPREEYDRVKEMLDTLHLRKIDLADEVLILNVGNYIGQSTARELAYARQAGKKIRFLEAPVQEGDVK